MTDAGGRVPRHPGRRQRGRGGEVLRLEPGGAGGGARGRGRPQRGDGVRGHRARGRSSTDGACSSAGCRIAELARDSGTGEDETRRWLDSVRAQLLVERSKRIAPGRDDKVLAGWNGLMIRGLAFASRVFERPEWAERAPVPRARCSTASCRATASSACTRTGSSKVDAFLEDWGGLASGLVALYQATFDPRWLEAAVQLADGAQERFWDPEQKAYRTAPRGQADLVVEAYALHDNAVPSGASLLTEANVVLAALTGRHAYLDRAEAYLSRMRDAALANPFAYGHLWCAADARRRRSAGRGAGREPERARAVRRAARHGRTRRRSRSRRSRPERRRRSWRSSPTGRPRPGPLPRRTCAGTSPARCRGSHRRRSGRSSRGRGSSPRPGREGVETTATDD